MLAILSIFCLLNIAAFCCAIETAFTASAPSKMHKMKNKSPKQVHATLLLLKTKDKVISTFLIIYSIVSTVATTLMTTFLVSKYGSEKGTMFSSIIMSGLVIIYAEAIPKAIAVAKAETIALHSVHIVRFSIFLFKPINYLLHFLVKIFCFVFGVNLKAVISPTDEVRGVIEHLHSEGSVLKTERDMLDGILEIAYMDVSEIMVHRSHIESMAIDLPVKQMMGRALSSPYSRIPIWKDNRDNVIGILVVRDLLKAAYQNDFDLNKINIQNLMLDPYFVPDNVSVQQQLHLFRSQPDLMAIVVDEYGDLQGLVTLEDILEEIVGKITANKQQIIKQNNRKFIIDGATTIRDINRELDWDLPDAEANTIVGLVINTIGRLPEQGEKFVIYDNFRVTIKKKLNNRIKTIVIEQL